MRHHEALAALAAAAIAHTVMAADCFTTFAGPLASTRPAFEAAAGAPVPLENFESIGHGVAVGDMPGLQAHFAAEYADGSPAPLPIVYANSPVTSPNWMINFFNGRPAWSSWVVRPDEGESIYAFGQVNSQGDTVRIEAFDEADVLIGSVDAPALSHAFAGFVSSVPIAKVVITPLGNFDGSNGMDDVQVSVAPPCYADADGSGDLSFFDFLAYTNDFNAGDSCADCDADGVLNFFDFLCFMNAFNEGC
jgi:hypothetical protein